MQLQIQNSPQLLCYPNLIPTPHSQTVTTTPSSLFLSPHRYFLGNVLFLHLNHPHAPTQHVWNAMKLYRINPILGVCALTYSRIRCGTCSVTLSCVLATCSDNFLNCVVWSEDLRSAARVETSLSSLEMRVSRVAINWVLGRRERRRSWFVLMVVDCVVRRSKRLEMDLVRRLRRLFRSSYWVLPVLSEEGVGCCWWAGGCRGGFAGGACRGEVGRWGRARI